jgi:hypothetical protein
MTKGKNSRVFANIRCKIQDRGKIGLVCGFHDKNVKMLQIKWDGEKQVREYLPTHVTTEIKTSESVTEKKTEQNERKFEIKREKKRV